MITAVLTIDDVPSCNTPDIVDYLNSKGITAVMFAVGKNIEKHYDNAIYALQHGMIIGNHTYSHPHMSALSFEEAIEQIEKNELILDKLYKDAGVTRKYRPFRFPYGDKGGENKKAFQRYFRENGFNKLVDTQIQFKWWREGELSTDIDTFWTFDVAEYNIRRGSGFTEEDVYKRIDEEDTQYRGALLGEGNSHIILLHAHDETEEMVPEYYKKFIGHMLDKGLVFTEPKFFGI
ncbi:MAG: polysaccharide deacetylase family protein [Lachnospiraceae bacterium]|nr:polysaccharide deacetylase family protein [Lachnospiraceae bacterium]